MGAWTLHEATGSAPRQCASTTTAQRWVPAGELVLGASRQPLPDALPSARVPVSGFWIDVTEVTQQQFAAFVEATGYQTEAEAAGEAPVFVHPSGNRSGGWLLQSGASWRAPEGPGGRPGASSEPVRQISAADAAAYARWRGRDLPTEAEWEHAARGGLSGASYVWGESDVREAGFPANTWQGPFPAVDRASDGFAGVAPVGCFVANGYGLHDMAGNVWEWVRPEPESHAADGRPRTIARSATIKGGSYLCSPDYCARYQPSARLRVSDGAPSIHIGFRTVCRPPRCPAPTEYAGTRRAIRDGHHQGGEHQ